MAHHILSLGAGVQSSAMALMFVSGCLVLPVGDQISCAIFADTGAEPDGVYSYLDYLEGLLPYPVYRVKHKDGLLSEIMNGPNSREKRYSKGTPPFFAKESRAALMRQCTEDFKIFPIRRKVRELIGKKARAIVHIGISLDEAHRMKPSRVAFIENQWPLVDARITRQQCLAWVEEHGYKKPPRSACTFCPYHSDAEWRRLRDGDPAGWAQAVSVDEFIRTGWTNRIRDTLYLHRSHEPLAIAKLSAEERGQASMFGNECEGMCGV